MLEAYSNIGRTLASIRISNGSPLVYYDHYTKLHIVARQRHVMNALVEVVGYLEMRHLCIRLSIEELWQYDRYAS